MRRQHPHMELFLRFFLLGQALFGLVILTTETTGGPGWGSAHAHLPAPPPEGSLHPYVALQQKPR